MKKFPQDGKTRFSLRQLLIFILVMQPIGAMIAKIEDFSWEKRWVIFIMVFIYTAAIIWGYYKPERGNEKK